MISLNTRLSWTIDDTRLVKNDKQMELEDKRNFGHTQNSDASVLQCRVGGVDKGWQGMKKEPVSIMVVHTSCTKGLELVPVTPFIIESKGDGTLLFVVRALFLKAVSASLFPFLNLSFSTNCVFVTDNREDVQLQFPTQLNVSGTVSCSHPYLNNIYLLKIVHDISSEI
ncbi:uncharacterized protein G2W53_016428 [Senna tora]|uniref:Uncharacterized protein n=1 Tax=Senna tora TaxID=362788 RepID=A0A834TPE1_9FABA|nr:uncharacterized protein G2W53_016428 [Senna tora]